MSTRTCHTGSSKQPPTKKRRAQHPRSLADNESLACVASPFGPIRTLVASQVEKEIFLERLDKEIVKRFSFSLSNSKVGQQQRQQQGPMFLVGGKLVSRNQGNNNVNERNKRKMNDCNGDNNNIDSECEDVSKEQVDSTQQPPKDMLLKMRMIVGTNQCTRALESAMAGAGPAPALVVLAKDLHPPTILAHILLLAKQKVAPILLLPGRASVELGKILGTKKVGIFIMLPSVAADKESDIRSGYHKDIDSFIEFVKAKLLSTAA